MAKKIVIGGKNISSKIIGGDVFNSPFTRTLFDNGAFKIETSTLSNKSNSFADRLVTSYKNITLKDIKVENILDLQNFEKENVIKLNFDKTNLNNYSYFSSLRSNIETSINNIVNKWCGSLFITNGDEDGLAYNIYDYSYNASENISSFKVPIFLVQNHFKLLIDNVIINDEILNNTPQYKNLLDNFNNFQLLINNNEYNVVGFTGLSHSNRNFLYFTIQGEPFNIYGGGAKKITDVFHIKPNTKLYKKFYTQLSNLEKYLLTYKDNTTYIAEFSVPLETDSNYYFQKVAYYWRRSDGYNIDYTGALFENYKNSLLELGNIYDEFKSNYLKRFLTPSSILLLDATQGKKMDIVLDIYGKAFDEVKNFIDGLACASKVTYDKKDNVADVFVKSLAKTIGWDVYNIIEDEQLINKIVDNKDGVISSLPSEMDIELWRRLVVNSFWIFKSKGTRKSVEVLLSFIGIPDALVELNEFVYIANDKIKVTDSINSQILPYSNTMTKLPYDGEGYPVSFSEDDRLYFQSYGNLDSGQEYINIYRKLGYQLEKVVDNKKSWVYTNSREVRGDSSTEYVVNDSRLVINTKEIGLKIDAARAIENAMYNYNKANLYPISTSNSIFGLRSVPYPQRKSTDIDVRNLSFIQYVKEAYTKFIDATNRKILTNNRNTYPTLMMLYYDYINRGLAVGSKLDTKTILDILKRLDTKWGEFITQVIPATSIVDIGEEHYRNTVFATQKFNYKPGIDAGSEFAEVQLPILEDNINTHKISGAIDLPIESQIVVVTLSGTVSNESENDLFVYVENKNLARYVYSSNNDILDLPTLTQTGYTTITSGITPYIINDTLTNDSIYLYNENSGHTIIHNFTANTVTSGLSMQTLLYAFDYVNNKFDLQNVLHQNITTANTFSISSGTISFVIPNSVLSPNKDYLIKNIFNYNNNNLFTAHTISSSTPFNYYDNFHTNIYPSYINRSDIEFFFNRNLYSEYTGFSINNIQDLPINEYNFAIENGYFVAVSNAPFPNIILPEGNTINSNERLINEVIGITSGMTAFTISFVPSGDVEVTVNGVTLQKGTDYTNTNTGFPNIDRVSFILTEPLFPIEHHLSCIYLTDSQASNIKNETYTVSVPILSGDSTYSGNGIIFNTDNNKYEIFLENEILNRNDIIVTYNGITLTNNADYNISIVNNRRILLNTTSLNENDIFNIIYLSNTTLPDDNGIIDIDINNNPFTIDFELSSPLSNISGNSIIHNFYNNTDTGFTTSILSINSNIVDNQTLYTQTFDLNDLSPIITEGNSYLYQITTNVVFKAINNQDIITENKSIKIRLNF